MDERQEKSILEMGRGAIMERADYEMRAMIRNILDPNTSAKAARKLNITLTFKPGDDRQTIVVECVAKSTLASTNAITTMLYVLDEDTVVEMAPQIPGQLAVDAGEQEAQADPLGLIFKKGTISPCLKKHFSTSLMVCGRQRRISAAVRMSSHPPVRRKSLRRQSHRPLFSSTAWIPS